MRKLLGILAFVMVMSVASYAAAGDHHGGGDYHHGGHYYGHYGSFGLYVAPPAPVVVAPYPDYYVVPAPAPVVPYPYYYGYPGASVRVRTHGFSFGVGW